MTVSMIKKQPKTEGTIITIVCQFECTSKKMTKELNNNKNLCQLNCISGGRKKKQILEA